jgi:GH15 family glucan-1,4-alpha-glucosidase
VAFDRAIKTVGPFGLPGPVEKWIKVRDTIHGEICRHAFNPPLNAFTQYYGSETLDASVLLMPLVGFLPATDPRVVGTVAAVERHLVRDGFVLRYDTARRAADTGEHVDGLPPGEGAFLACSYWLADIYVRLGRLADAEQLFERLLRLTNDVGLLAEEYDPRSGRLLGNFPQAFSHLSLVNTACNLAPALTSPAEHRAGGELLP